MGGIMAFVIVENGVMRQFANERAIAHYGLTRTSSFKSFHFGSISGEIRLDERLTKEWQERFDAEGEKLDRKE